MASLYRRKNSGFWWIKYHDTSGALRQESTGCSISNPVHTRKARVILAQRNLAELDRVDARNEHRFSDWVPHYIATGPFSHLTRSTYNNAWRAISAYFAERKIVIPHVVTYMVIQEYGPWRMTPHPQCGIRTVSKNTAIFEAGFIGHLMNEAVRREIVESNPIRKCQFKWEPRNTKPEIPDADIERI